MQNYADEGFSQKGNAVTIPASVPLDVPVIMYREQRVITTELLARGYGASEKNIRDNFSRNLSRFEEGKHYFMLQGEELQEFKSLPALSGVVNKYTSQLILWTERGASRHAKMLETDQAWDFYEQLEDNYFNLREVYGVMLPDMLDPIQLARAWADAMEARKQVEVLNHRQAQYINHLENLFSDGLSPVQFCKRLNGVNASKVSAFLQGANWLYDDNPNGHSAQWRVRSQVRDKYLTEKSSKIKPSSSASFTTYQPVLLRDGAVWLYRKYLKGQLPMKHSWNGEYTHYKELAGGN